MVRVFYASCAGRGRARSEPNDPVPIRWARYPAEPQPPSISAIIAAMTPMRHALSIVAATAVAVGLAVGIHSFGAHDSSGFLTVILGYPGIAVISATELENRDAEVLFTVVNWLFYIGVFEAILHLRQRLSRRR